MIGQRHPLLPKAVLFLLLAAASILPQKTTVQASSNSNNAAAVMKQMEHYWSDPSDILDNLEDYELLWIQPSGCVWSECAVDDTDDAYMGDNRDGDEKWYLYRTQNFCANAAFSLYGIRKDDKHNQRVRDWRGCSRKHFINSYFTYGGADVLLESLGIKPEVFFQNNYYNNNGGRQRALEDNANDDGAAAAYDDDAAAAANDDYAAASYYTNADCLEVDGSDVTHYQGKSKEGDGEERQHDGDQEYTYMSTMGCSRYGSDATAASFVMARFEATTCDGNKYLDTVDDLESYNAQHEDIGQCRRIWDAEWSSNSNGGNVTYLMQNAWTCDVALYPDGCPDPYGQKAKFLHALQTAARGGNAKLALKNMNAKQPLRVTSLILTVMATLVVGFGYFMKNHKRIAVDMADRRARSSTTTDMSSTTTLAKLQMAVFFVVAYLKCIWEDVSSQVITWWRGMSTFVVAMCMTKGCLKKVGRPTQTSSSSQNNDKAKALLQEEEEDNASRVSSNPSGVDETVSDSDDDGNSESPVAPIIEEQKSVESAKEKKEIPSNAETDKAGKIV